MTRFLPIAVAALAALATLPLQAAEKYPWRQHAQPYTFLFGNAIDGHQQTRLNRDGSLKGYLYIHYTGMVTKDKYPVATHVDCNTAIDCSVGWTIKGLPARATLVREPMHDHPLFLIGRADIPQPGSYSHFHWTGPVMPIHQSPVPARGYLLELTATNRFCFIHHGVAMSELTCRDNGGVAVERGIDIATHLNITPVNPDGM